MTKPVGSTRLAMANGRSPEKYVEIKCEDGKWRLQHRVVMEELLGRKLVRGEFIHHKDGDKTNNDANNLEILGHHERLSVNGPINYKREHDPKTGRFKRSGK